MPFTCLTKTFSWLCACVAFAAIISVEAAHATIYYVATNGSDSYPGTNAQPLRTIAGGVKMLSAGDTLYVKSGTYAESIRHWQVPISNGTSWSNPITVAANPGDTVTIKPLANNAFFWIGDGQSKYLIIKGFIIDGAHTALHGFKFESGTKYVRVIDCELKNAKNSGILVTNHNTSSSNIINTYHEFINLKVHHNGSSGEDHGFYIETSYNLVASSQFYNNKGNGGKFYHGNLSGVANNNIARNNKFYDNSVAGVWSCGLLLSSGNGTQAYNNVAYGNFAGFCIQARVTNARLYNNLTYNNDVYGVYVGLKATSGSRVENNTVYNNGTYGIFVGDGATTTTVKNNIVRSNNNDLGLTNTTSSNNFTTDPLFANAAGKDFRLQASSQAIDKGTAISGLGIDLDGKPRPKGAAFDIGAYEYQGSGSTGGSTSPSSPPATPSSPPATPSSPPAIPKSPPATPSTPPATPKSPPAIPSSFFPSIASINLLGGASSEWQIVGVGDVNADSMMDVIWRHSTSGVVAVWLMDGLAITATGFPGSTSMDFEIAGVGDVDGDGRADLVWRNTSNGSVAIWLMHGTEISLSGFPAGVPLEWQIAGVGDVNADSKEDVIWRNSNSGVVAVWLMDGLTITATGFPGSASRDFEIIGAGDVDGDGTADLLWRNTASGVVAVWLMDGLTIAATGFPGSASTEFEVAGIGDVDGDAKADIVWRNTANGVVAMWLLNGATIGSSGFLGGVPTNWVIAQVSDVDGNGNADVIWRNNSSGEVNAWVMTEK